MPVDFLLPLFVVTLVANAFLVAFAIRGMRRGQPDDDRSRWNDRPPTTTRSSRSAAPYPIERAPFEQPAAEQPAAEPSGLIEPAPSVDVGPVGPAEPAPSLDPEPAVRPAEPASDPAPDARADTTGTAGEPAPVAAPKRRRTKAASDAPATRSRSTEPRRARRRFSLPPLDDDHEKVNRSIESFLGGVDSSGPGPAGAEPVTTSAPASRNPAREAAAGATTVALIAVDGLRNPGETGPRTPRSGPASSPALAMVERTLRGAARGTDLVTIRRRGRLQIELQATGELAARAYLRRIRAAIEPALEAADPALRLTVATATVLDEPLRVAIRRAEDRLALALDAAHEADRQTREATEDDQDEADSGQADERRAPRAAAD